MKERKEVTKMKANKTLSAAILSAMGGVIFLLALIVVSTSGCSVYKAANYAPKKNLEVLNLGIHRDAVRAELGAPVSSGRDGELEYDVFGFEEGNSKGWGITRAFLYGVADVFTVGLTEVITTPIEGGISGGPRMNIRVIYDQSKRVLRVEDLTPKPPPPKTQ